MHVCRYEQNKFTTPNIINMALLSSWAYVFNYEILLKDTTKFVNFYNLL